MSDYYIKKIHLIKIAWFYSVIIYRGPPNGPLGNVCGKWHGWNTLKILSVDLEKRLCTGSYYKKIFSVFIKLIVISHSCLFESHPLFEIIFYNQLSSFQYNLFVLLSLLKISFLGSDTSSTLALVFGLSIFWASSITR